MRKAGLLTTIQDSGRQGWQIQGVSVAGAADTQSFQIANALVGNDINAAALEFVIIGAELEFLADCVVAFHGAHFDLKVDGSNVANGKPIWLCAGSVLRVGEAISGSYGYLAISGGLKVSDVLGSKSTYLNGGFGGLNGRALRNGDQIECYPASRKFSVLRAIATDKGKGHATPSWACHNQWDSWRTSNKKISFICSSSWYQLDEDDRIQFLAEKYQINSNSNRMGVRLKGFKLYIPRSPSDKSFPVTFGSVQIPPDGQPIILSVDRQSIGGYPIIGTVRSSDAQALVQSRAGQTFQFNECTLDEAQKQFVAKNNEQVKLLIIISHRIKELR